MVRIFTAATALLVAAAVAGVGAYNLLEWTDPVSEEASGSDSADIQNSSRSNFLSTDAPAGRVDLAVAAAPDGLKAEAIPDIRPGAGPDVDIAATQATTEKNKQVQYGQWTVSCTDAPGGEAGKCFVRLAVHDKKRNVTVVNWLIGYNKDSKLLMEITTPADVLIEPGLQLSMANGKVQRFPYLSCAPAGCITRIGPDAAMLNGLRKAENVKLGIATTNGKTLVFTIKVDGIADGLNALAGL